MTTRSINDQIRIIKNATEKASSSKEAAISFLRKAGIINVVDDRKSKSVKPRKWQVVAGWHVEKLTNDSKFIEYSARTGTFAQRKEGKFSTQKQAADSIRELGTKYPQAKKVSSKK